MPKYIPEEIIDEIRQQADIVEILSEYVLLERTGKNYKGLCPFHQEKTPSFVVNPVKQIFHCYGCGVGGNVFTFLMQHEKYTFPEAAHFLAKKIGILLPERTRTVTTPQGQRLERLYQMHRDAAEYFSAQLMQSEQGQQARAYLKERGIQEEVIQTFSLGYAPPDWDGLWKTLIRKYSRELLLESGLIIKKKNGVGQYDRFRDRVMIPIHDDRGRIVAFGGRILGPGEPKYLNSPETSIFHKGQTLFGLYHVKDIVRRTGYILIVEGYFDMIVPYSSGVKNIVATMGTALTGKHLHLLQRYIKKATLMFDADPAGIKAAQRTLDLFLDSGFHVGDVNAVMLPQGDDPDTAVRRMGTEQFQEYIRQAPSLLDFVRERIIEQHDISRDDQKIECINQLLPTIVKIKNLVERDNQRNRTVDLLKVTDAALLQELKKAVLHGKPHLVEDILKNKTAIPLLEVYLIKALLKDKSLIPYVQDRLDPLELSHPIAQKILRELFVYNDKTHFESRILDVFHDLQYQGSLANLLIDDEEIIDPKKTVQDCLRRLKQRDFEQATHDVTRKVRDAQQKKNAEILNTLLEQKNRDLQKKKSEFS